MPRAPLTCPSPVDILEEPLDTVPSRELGRRHGFTRTRARRAIVDAVTT